MILDLHGVKHQDVTVKFDTFIWEAIQAKVVEVSIITGNSLSMQTITRKCISEYGFTILPFEENMGTIKININ